MRKTIGAVGLASVALLLGTGPAQADVTASAEPTLGGVAVTVGSTAGDAGPAVSGMCLYTATVQGNSLGRPLPPLSVPFFLPEGGTATLRIPSYQTGSTWNVKITCPSWGGPISQYTTMVW